MKIEQLLKFANSCGDDREAVKMILANRIDCYCGDTIGAVISIKSFPGLAEDIIAWHNSKLTTTAQGARGNE